MKRSYTEFLQDILDAITAHHASLSELDFLFTSLQHRAFRGEL
jgi:hypothetical protein